MQWLGQPFSTVHDWLDQPFTMYGASHRKERHHLEGIWEASSLFGEVAGRAAAIHVLRDCLGIPKQSDYLSGSVDPLGYPVEMPIEDIVTFTEEDFERLVGSYMAAVPKDILIWAWLKNEDQARHLLQNISSAVEEDASAIVEKLRGRRDEAKVPYAISNESFRSAQEQYGPYIEENFSTLFAALAERHGQAEFGFVQASALINPLQVVEDAFVSFLAEDFDLSGGEFGAVQFALPSQVNVKIRADSDARSATVMTRFQQFSLNSVNAELVPGNGLEVRFTLGAIPQLIIVVEFEKRFYLMAGMHRAFLLARSGLSEIPCVVVTGRKIPMVKGPYPSHPLSALMQSRPPLLIDALNSEFSSTFHFQETNRVIRISAEDFVVPVD